jgi:hypothetical protein
MPPYDSLTSLLTWQPTEEESDYLLGYALPLIRGYFNHSGQHLVIGPNHNVRFD